MFTAFVIAFLALGRLDSSSNIFSFASPYQNAAEDNVLDDSIPDDVEQDGIDRNDLEEQNDDKGLPRRDEYSMALEEPESVLSEEPEDPLELGLPMVKEDDRKEKRWIWSKKAKQEKKNNWVFNTGAPESARGSILPEDEHVRNRAAELYGNQYDKGISTSGNLA